MNKWPIKYLTTLEVLGHFHVINGSSVRKVDQVTSWSEKRPI